MFGGLLPLKPIQLWGRPACSRSFYLYFLSFRAFFVSISSVSATISSASISPAFFALSARFFSARSIPPDRSFFHGVHLLLSLYAYSSLLP